MTGNERRCHRTACDRSLTSIAKALAQLDWAESADAIPASLDSQVTFLEIAVAVQHGFCGPFCMLQDAQDRLLKTELWFQRAYAGEELQRAFEAPSMPTPESTWLKDDQADTITRAGGPEPDDPADSNGGVRP